VGLPTQSPTPRKHLDSLKTMQHPAVRVARDRELGPSPSREDRSFPFLAAAILCLAGIAVLPFAGCGGNTAGSVELDGSQASPRRRQTVKIATVAMNQLTARAEFTGNLLPRRRTLIVAEVEGIIHDIADIGPLVEIDNDGKHYSEQLGILPGQEVRAGEVLVQLDRTTFELNVALAEAKLAKTNAELAHLKAWDRPEVINRLEALRDEARARHELATADHRREKVLSSSRAISMSDLEQAAMEVQTNRASLASQEAILRQAHAGPTAEEIAVQEALVKQADVELQREQRLLAKTIIRAPYDGVITEIHVEEGDLVSVSSGPLLELLDLRFVVAEVGDPESYLGKVRLQDRALVSIAGPVEPVAGLVVGINHKVDPESRSFRVRVAIDNADKRFMAGQFARVSLSLGGLQRNLVLRSSAITFIEGQPGVFVFDEGVAKRHSIELGMSDATSTEVLAGLNPGDCIIVEDPTRDKTTSTVLRNFGQRTTSRL